MTWDWDTFLVDFTCCHELLGVTHTSVLDHFFWSETVGNYVSNAGVLHLPDNRSDHSPVFCVVNLDLQQQASAAAAKQVPRPAWKKASHEEKQNYKNLLD